MDSSSVLTTVLLLFTNRCAPQPYPHSLWIKAKNLHWLQGVPKGRAMCILSVYNNPNVRSRAVQSPNCRSLKHKHWFTPCMLHSSRSATQQLCEEGTSFLLSVPFKPSAFKELLFNEQCCFVYSLKYKKKSAIFLCSYDMLVLCSTFISLLCLQASCCQYSKEMQSHCRKKKSSVSLCIVLWFFFSPPLLLCLCGVLLQKGIIRKMM